MFLPLNGVFCLVCIPSRLCKDEKGRRGSTRDSESSDPTGDSGWTHIPTPPYHSLEIRKRESERVTSKVNLLDLTLASLEEMGKEEIVKNL